MFDTPTEELANPVDWLDTTPAATAPGDLARLRAALSQLAYFPIDGRHATLLARADSFLHALLQQLRPRLREAVLPLTREARERSVAVSDALEHLARNHQRQLRATGSAESARAGLLALYRRFEVCALAGASTPAGLWQLAGELYRGAAPGMAGARNDDDPAQDTAQNAHLIFIRLLALGCASPEHLSAAEIGELVDWLDETMIPVVLYAELPAGADETWFWTDLDLDQGPHQLGRRAPPGRSGVVTFSLGPLASHALASAALLEPAKDGAAEGEALTARLLRRVSDMFSTAHRRRLTRRRNNYRVAMCVGLKEVRSAIAGTETSPPSCSEWMVVNESAGGFAVMHIGGHIEGIVSGGIVALRADEDEPWIVCLVRWSRSDNPEHVELGLQVLGSGAQTVEIAFRANGSGGARTLTPALLLPAIPGLRPKFAILAPAGTYTSRRFVMVAHTGHVYVTQGRLISLDLQTATIELFQFELDPYPM